MNNLPVVIDSKTVEDYLFSSGTKLSQQQKAMFVQMAVRSGLDPFKREIHAIVYGNNFNIVTGYQTYIARANATGLLNGWNAESMGDKAKVTIHRKDWENPFIWEVSRKEFDKGQSNWKSMPEFMLKKVCIAQAFRLAFPEQLGGLPYTSDEIQGEPIIIEEAKPLPAPGPKAPATPAPLKPSPNLPARPEQKKRILELAEQTGLPKEDIIAYCNTTLRGIDNKHETLLSASEMTAMQASLVIAELQKILENKEVVNAATGTLPL